MARTLDPNALDQGHGMAVILRADEKVRRAVVRRKKNTSARIGIGRTKQTPTVEDEPKEVSELRASRYMLELTRAQLAHEASSRPDCALGLIPVSTQVRPVAVMCVACCCGTTWSRALMGTEDRGPIIASRLRCPDDSGWFSLAPGKSQPLLCRNQQSSENSDRRGAEPRYRTDHRSAGAGLACSARFGPCRARHVDAPPQERISNPSVFFTKRRLRAPFPFPGAMTMGNGTICVAG